MSNHTLQYRAQAHYNAWFNERLFDAAALMSDEARKRDAGAFFGSVHRTLNHILLGDRIWLGRLATTPGGFSAFDAATLISGSYALDAELYEDFEQLRAQRRDTDAVICAFADELTDEVLASSMRYANSRGTSREHPTWIAVSHLFNHQTHHRGQVTTLLAQVGIDPGVTDMFVPAIDFINQ